jgi:hypothetical protein
MTRATSVTLLMHCRDKFVVLIAERLAAAKGNAS